MEDLKIGVLDHNNDGSVYKALKDWKDLLKADSVNTIKIAEEDYVDTTVDTKQLEEAKSLIEENCFEKLDKKLETDDLIGCRLVYIKKTGNGTGIISTYYKNDEVAGFKTTLELIEKPFKIYFQLSNKKVYVFLSPEFEDQFIVSEEDVLDFITKLLANDNLVLYSNIIFNKDFSCDLFKDYMGSIKYVDSIPKNITWTCKQQGTSTIPNSIKNLTMKVNYNQDTTIGINNKGNAQTGLSINPIFVSQNSSRTI